LLQKYLFYLISIGQTFFIMLANMPQLYKISGIYFVVLLRSIFVSCIELLYLTNYYATCFIGGSHCIIAP